MESVGHPGALEEHWYNIGRSTSECLVVSISIRGTCSRMSFYEQGVLTMLMFSSCNYDPILTDIFSRVTKFKRSWKFESNMNITLKIIQLLQVVS